MQGQTNQKILRGKLQRNLRSAPTDAEHHLWQHLRKRQIGNCKFRRQHPYGNYILDFVCLERKVVIELDGGQHDAHHEYDTKRDGSLQCAGFAVLRFWNNQIFAELDGVLDVISQTLHMRARPSSPNPPLEGEG